MKTSSVLRRLARDEVGVSGIEFAIIAPVMIVGVLLMVDVGIAIGARMEMDRNVRAGAQAAMSLNNDMVAIEEIILASNEAPEALAVSADMECLCAGAVAACSTPCAGGNAPSVFVDISASQPLAGMLVPERTLTSRTRVQIR